MFFKIDVLKNFANFTGEHLYWGLFSIKLQAFRPATLLKRDSNTVVFLWNLRNFSEHLHWLLLNIKIISASFNWWIKCLASNVDKTLNFVNQFIFLMAFAVKCTLQFLGFLINFVIVISVRSSRPEVFCKKGVLRNFAKFTGKHLYHSLFFNKVAVLFMVPKKVLWRRIHCKKSL